MALPSAAFQVEAAVIGAGVIGLAVARSLAMAGKEVIILDRAGHIGSGENSNAIVCKLTACFGTNDITS